MPFLNSRPGEFNNDGVVDALFMDKWAGEVLTAFHSNNIAMDLMTIKTLSEGKSVIFNHLGKTTSGYLSAGGQISTDKILHGETVITIDEKCYGASSVYDVQEAKSSYEVRSKYTAEAGEALAKNYDINSFLTMLLAARSANKITGLAGGSQIEIAGAAGAPTAANLAAAIFTAAETFVTKNIDPSKATCILRPHEFYTLVQNRDLLNKDWGGEGSYARAELPQVAGIPIQVSNNLPSTHVTGTNGSKYDLDCSNTYGLIVGPEAAASAHLMGLKTESERRIDYQDWYFVSAMTVGHGVLRPEQAIELINAA